MKNLLIIKSFEYLKSYLVYEYKYIDLPLSMCGSSMESRLYDNSESVIIMKTWCKFSQ
jgi:hypothetical protein